MSLRYEIEEVTNAVKVFYNNDTVPSLYQPNFPNGEVWSDAEEAAVWAELYIASVLDRDAPFAPNARGVEGRAKPTDEQIASMQAQKEAHRNTSV